MQLALPFFLSFDVFCKHCHTSHFGVSHLELRWKYWTPSQCTHARLCGTCKMMSSTKFSKLSCSEKIYLFECSPTNKSWATYDLHNFFTFEVFLAWDTSKLKHVRTLLSKLPQTNCWKIRLHVQCQWRSNFPLQIYIWSPKMLGKTLYAQ